MTVAVKCSFAARFLYARATFPCPYRHHPRIASDFHFASLFPSMDRKTKEDADRPWSDGFDVPVQPPVGAISTLRPDQYDTQLSPITFCKRSAPYKTPYFFLHSHLIHTHKWPELPSFSCISA